MNDSGEKKRIDLIYNLNLLLNKIVSIRFIGGKTVKGKLIKFDKVPNLVLAKVGDKEWIYGKDIFCNGHSIYSIELTE